MLALFLSLTVAFSSPFAQETHDAYARQDADALRALLAQASSRTDSLLVQYRLYPVTEDRSVLDDLPEALPGGSARELALLSGLWAYRAGEASLFRVIQYGRRSTQLLEAAKKKDPDAPFVLLVEGQSLLFRPSFAGPNPHAAVDRFHELALLTRRSSQSGISEVEALTWLWLALREAGRVVDADTIRATLTDHDPPPLYQAFLDDPPNV